MHRGFVIAVCIAVYSHAPFRAAMNVFLFFVGFVASYYLYCNFVAGFFPRSYAMIWIAYTIASPFLGFLCWYAKGKGWVALNSFRRHFGSFGEHCFCVWNVLYRYSFLAEPFNVADWNTCFTKIRQGNNLYDGDFHCFCANY